MTDLSKDGSTNPNDQERFKGVSLAARKCELVQNLQGFKKAKHRIPEEITTRTQTFVGGLGADQIREDLDRVFASLRSAFRFKRTQLQTHETDDGAGSITTPFFRYTSCVYQNPANASEVIWQRDISDVTEPGKLLSSNFAEAFGEVFDTVEFVPNSAIDLERLVDVVEEIDDDRVTLEYDRNLTYCEIAIEGTTAKIHVTKEAFRIVHPEPTDPRVLVSSFFEVQDALVDFSSLT